MNLYVFGNQDESQDSISLAVAKDLAATFPQLQLVIVKPNQDLPFAEVNVPIIILDVAQGIETIQVINEDQLASLQLAPRSTVHDFDLGFQLRYLKKLGKLPPVTLVCLPYDRTVDYSLLQSIFRKLVAQDMQGS